MKRQSLKFVSAFLLILGLNIVLVVQSQTGSNLPRKFDSYSAIACDDAMARLDRFAIHLQNEPDAQGYIVVYRERNGLLGKYLSYMNFAKEYLAKTRGISPERITTLSGGYRDSLTTELWIAPQHATLPIATTVLESVNTVTARKFDEGFADFKVYQGKRGLWTFDLCGLGAIDLSAYAEQLRAEPNSIGHIIIYTERGKPVSRARIMARLLRDEMVKKHKIAAHRIAIVYGRPRELPEAELWIVPKGAASPKPSPKARRLSRGDHIKACPTLI